MLILKGAGLLKFIIRFSDSKKQQRGKLLLLINCVDWLDCRFLNIFLCLSNIYNTNIQPIDLQCKT